MTSSSDHRTGAAWRRLAARVIDLAGSAALLIFVGALNENAVWLAFPFLIFVYPVVGHWTYGQTLGKRLVGIRVVRADGASIGFWRSLLRSSVEAGAVVVVFVITATAWFLTYWDEVDSDGWGGFLGAFLLALVSVLVGTVCAFGMWVLDAALAFTNAQRRTLHDSLSGTRVVRAG